MGNAKSIEDHRKADNGLKKTGITQHWHSYKLLSVITNRMFMNLVWPDPGRFINHSQPIRKWGWEPIKARYFLEDSWKRWPPSKSAWLSLPTDFVYRPKMALVLDSMGPSPCYSYQKLSQPWKAAVVTQQRQWPQQSFCGKYGCGIVSWQRPVGCCVIGFSLECTFETCSDSIFPATRGCSFSDLTAKKAVKSKSSMVTPPRGVGVFWRHCGHGIHHCSLATMLRRLMQVWQKVWPQ